jgi:uroporphyrinogen-III decarboxylase
LAFAEGNYEPRLEIIKDMPKASLIWYFEQMDMAKAKEVLGGNVCIAGNLPASVLCIGTPQEVKERCRYLIETCGKGGGYILAASMHLDECIPDNLHAMIEAVKEYGVYVK